MTERYALMWSGGKDSALAVSRAQSLGLDVTKLLNFYDVTTGRVRFHATTVTMLQVQAEALGIELRAVGSTWAEMDVRFSQELTTLRSDGFDGVVFGDIHLGDVRAWYEERVTAAGLRHVEPIWGESPPKLVEEFVEAGGRAVITCVDLSRLDSSWLGRLIDEHFLDAISQAKVDACGENGEYHSFAFAGPMFKHPVAWRAGEIHAEPGFMQLDLAPALSTQDY